MKEYAFGIDLGGTTAKAGLFTTAGTLLEKWEIPTDTSDQGVRILPNLAAAILDKMKEKALTPGQVEGVGIGVPGPVQESSVVPIVCANLGGWGQQDVAANLSSLLGGIKVLVGNDANVAALGEIWMGAAKGCRSAVMVTLGTGVGGGVIVNGKVIDGAHGAGGEIGHITVNPKETAVCGCGKHGCLEQYSSATGVVRCMKKLLEENPDTPCVLHRSHRRPRGVPGGRRRLPRRRRAVPAPDRALQGLRLQVLPGDPHQAGQPGQRRRHLRRRPPDRGRITPAGQKSQECQKAAASVWEAAALLFVFTWRTRRHGSRG